MRKERIHLENMRPGEKVLTVIRRHWIIYIFLTTYFLLGVFSTIIIYIIIGFSVSGNLLNIIFWLFFSMFIYMEWVNHELDLFIITNNRIIGVDQISFLNRTVSECNLGQVQEVNSKTKGFLSNIFNYGTLSIQTAGSITTLKMDYSPNAMQGARKILNIVDNYRDNNNKNGKSQNLRTKIKK